MGFCCGGSVGFPHFARFVVSVWLGWRTPSAPINVILPLKNKETVLCEDCSLPIPFKYMRIIFYVVDYIYWLCLFTENELSGLVFLSNVVHLRFLYNQWGFSSILLVLIYLLPVTIGVGQGEAFSMFNL